MAQDIIVYIIGALVVLRIAWKIVRALRRRDYNPCSGCNGCDLREQFRRKQTECREKRRNGQDSDHRPTGGCGCGCK